MSNPQDTLDAMVGQLADAEAVNTKLVQAWAKVPAVKLQWALANAIVSGDPDLTVKVLDELIADQDEYLAHQAVIQRERRRLGPELCDIAGCPDEGKFYDQHSINSLIYPGEHGKDRRVTA